jgi:hypothetical protein
MNHLISVCYIANEMEKAGGGMRNVRELVDSWRGLRRDIEWRLGKKWGREYIQGETGGIGVKLGWESSEWVPFRACCSRSLWLSGNLEGVAVACSRLTWGTVLQVGPQGEGGEGRVHRVPATLKAPTTGFLGEGGSSLWPLTGILTPLWRHCRILRSMHLQKMCSWELTPASHQHIDYIQNQER